MNRFILFLGLLFCSHLHIQAQIKTSKSQSNSSIDSLSRLFDAVKDDTTKIKIMVNAQARDNEYYKRPTPIINLYNKAIKIAEGIGDKKSAMKLLNRVAHIETYVNKDDPKGFKLYAKALTYAEEMKDYESAADLCYSIAAIYEHQNFKAEMYKYFFKSIEYNQKCSNFYYSPYRWAISFLLDDNKIQEALKISNQAINQVDSHPIPNELKLLAYGFHYSVLKRIPSKKQEAEFYKQKITQLLSGIKTLSVSNNHDFFATVCYEVEQYKLAIFFENQFLQKVDKNSQLESHKIETYRILSDSYEKLRDYPKSLEFYKKYSTAYLNELKSVTSLESGRKIIRAEGERNLLLKQKEIDKERFYRNISFTIAGFILLLAIISFYFYRRLQNQKTQLYELNATKDKLFTILSHDLRSPIALIENNLMLIDWGALSKNEFAETTQKLAIKVRNIRNLLDNLLTWALTQSNAMKPKSESINIIQIIEEEIEILSSLAQSKNIQINRNFQYQTSLLIDKNHLRFIGRNLLHNAIKFTNAGGKVQINVLENKDDVSIEIIDNGVGMTDNALASLFQMNSSDFTIGINGERGIGIGLVLVKELIELNNGNIIVNSKLNEGTSFKITFKNKIKA